VDEAGKERAELVVTAGEPALNLYDEAASLRAALGTHKNIAGLNLYDETASLRAALAESKDGPMLDLRDAQGYRAILGAAEIVSPETDTRTARSAASLVMFDKEKNRIWEAP